MIQSSPFWSSLQKLTATDNSISVPSLATNKLKAIFEPPKPVGFLTLQPAWGGMTRQISMENKFLYQTNGGFMVQLESNFDGKNWQLEGMLMDTQGPFRITLFGSGVLEETFEVEDQFLFDEVSPGNYRLCFEQEGATYWITSLTIGTDS